MKRCGKTYFIWDTDIFHSLVKEIKYFAELNLISANDGIHLKEELLQLLTELERLSVKGQFNNGHEAAIYLSNINFEATYSYITKKISKSVSSEYIPSISWIRKIRISAKCKRTGYNL